MLIPDNFNHVGGIGGETAELDILFVRPYGPQKLG